MNPLLQYRDGFGCSVLWLPQERSLIPPDHDDDDDNVDDDNNDDDNNDGDGDDNDDNLMEI